MAVSAVIEEQFVARADIDFQSMEALAEILESLGMALHAKNRIAGGESNFLWRLAELICKTGRLAKLYDSSPELRQEFGNGYTPGTLSETEQEERLIKLLRAQFASEGAPVR